MCYKIQLIATLAALAATRAHPLDQGPQTFGHQAQPPQQYKEVIMYLTPTQIREYEEHQRSQGHGTIKPVFEQEYHHNNDTNLQQLYQSEDNSNFQSYGHMQEQWSPQISSEQEQHQQQQLSRPNFQQIYVSSNADKGGFRPIAPQIQVVSGQQHKDNQPYQAHDHQNYVYFNFKPNIEQKLPSHGNMQPLFYPEPDFHKNQHENEQLYLNMIKTQEGSFEKFRLIPYEYLAESRQAHESLGRHLLEHPIIENPKRQSDEIHEQQYAPNFGHFEQIKAIINAIELEKLQARAKAEAIAQSPPVVVHKDISITRRRPIHIIKTVKVAVPAPFLVPVPQPYHVKVPQPYPVPVEIIRPFAIPVVKTEKVEVEKPVPYEVEKRVPVEVEKKVYVKVDKPFPVQRIVPVEIKKEVPVEVPVYEPEKLTIVRHVWDH